MFLFRSFKYNFTLGNSNHTCFKGVTSWEKGVSSLSLLFCQCPVQIQCPSSDQALLLHFFFKILIYISCWPFKCSLPHRLFYGSLFFIPTHKRLLNQRQHPFSKLSQSHCTFQILESWPWPQGNLIITRSARNNGKAFWPLINVRFRVAKVRFSQILEYSKHCITLAKERKEGKR